MRKFVFKLTVYEGNDEFWEGKPTPYNVQEVLEDMLFNAGFLDDEAVIEISSFSDDKGLSWN